MNSATSVNPTLSFVAIKCVSCWRRSGAGTSRPTAMPRSDVSGDEGPVRHGLAADDGLCRSPVAAGRPRLDRAGFQHTQAPSEDAGRQHPISRIKGAPHPLTDSTGIKVKGEGEWHAHKHGGSKRRVWRKIHLGIVVAAKTVS